jgi:hypothetical protein
MTFANEKKNINQDKTEIIIRITHKCRSKRSKIFMLLNGRTSIWKLSATP